jgi:protein TonB
MHPLASSRVLNMALAFSVLAHMALLAIRFVDPQPFNRVFQDTPLEVILVNGRSLESPEKALAIAQATLAGGGQLDSGRATSPLPPTQQSATGDVQQDADRDQDVLLRRQTELITQIRQAIRTLPSQPTAADVKEGETPADVRKRRRELVKMLAEIERRVSEESAKPKKRYISPATREEVYAVYYDTLRRRIEDRGTEQFPTAADGSKLYGELTMMITVGHDGRIQDTDVVQSSGNKRLDRRAQAIARNAGPFGPFTEAMRRKADQIVVVSRFRFTRDETLQTQMSAR